MKKTMNFFAAAVMVSLAAVACSKDNGGNKNNNDDDSNADVEGIVIDGNFDDWAKLPEAEVVMKEVESDADKKAVKLVKFYDTDELLYVYAEVDAAVIGTAYTEAEKWDSGKSQPRTLRLMFDADNNEDTGGKMPEFPEEPNGYDVLVDSYIWSNAGKIKLGWSECWTYIDPEANKQFLGMSPATSQQNVALDNMVVSAANVAGSLVKGGFYGVEYAVDKTNVPDLGKQVRVVALYVDDGWNNAGILPSDGTSIKLTLK